MASTKRRRHRRERRRARVKHPKIKRYMVKCRDQNGEEQNHWIYITEKGDILLRDHPGVQAKDMAHEGLLASYPQGCAYALKRIIEDNKMQYALQKTPLDVARMSDSLVKVMEKVHQKRVARIINTDYLRRCEMRPIRETLLYRRNLLLRHRIVFVHQLASRAYRRLRPEGDCALISYDDPMTIYSLKEGELGGAHYEWTY